MWHSFSYPVADVAQVYTKSGSKAAQCTEQLGHFQLFHPVGIWLQRDWNSTEQGIKKKWVHAFIHHYLVE